MWKTKPLGELRNQVMHPVTHPARKPHDKVELTSNIDNAIEIVEAAVSALRKKYPSVDSK
jgi:hypothetical protein